MVAPDWSQDAINPRELMLEPWWTPLQRYSRAAAATS
jgi:hypothetical protein